MEGASRQHRTSETGEEASCAHTSTEMRSIATLRFREDACLRMVNTCRTEWRQPFSGEAAPH